MMVLMTARITAIARVDTGAGELGDEQGGEQSENVLSTYPASGAALESSAAVVSVGFALGRRWLQTRHSSRNASGRATLAEVGLWPSADKPATSAYWWQLTRRTDIKTVRDRAVHIGFLCIPENLLMQVRR